MTTKEQAEYTQTKLVIEAVHRRLGVQREYRLRDFHRDEQLLRESVRRKRELRDRETAQIAAFERWWHGQKLA